MENQTKVGHTNKYEGMSKGKKQLAKEMARYYKCDTRYSGKRRIMYVIGENAEEAVIAIKAQVDPLFTLQAQ